MFKKHRYYVRTSTDINQMQDSYTKRGPYGILYKYEIIYTPDNELLVPEMTWHCWAYDDEHAILKFYDSNEGGFLPLKIAKMSQKPRSSWVYKKIY